MNPDFEKRLEEQPMREAPAGWRARILAQTRAQVEPPPPVWWREWLWPCPRAWAGLGAAWLVIFGLNLMTGKYPVQSAATPRGFSREELSDLRHQQEMLAEIVFPVETAEPPKLNPSPRSDVRKTEAVV